MHASDDWLQQTLFGPLLLSLTQTQNTEYHPNNFNGGLGTSTKNTEKLSTLQVKTVPKNFMHKGQETTLTSQEINKGRNLAQQQKKLESPYDM